MSNKILEKAQQPHSRFWCSDGRQTRKPFLLSCMPTESLCEIIGREYAWLSQLEVNAHLDRFDRTKLERLAAQVLDREQFNQPISQPVHQPVYQPIVQPAFATGGLPC